MESAKAFVEKLKADEEFAKKVSQCKDKEARMALAKEDGFDFTVDEVKEAASELSDEDLDNVAGGDTTGRLFAEFYNWLGIY